MTTAVATQATDTSSPIAVSIAAAIGVFVGEANALYIVAGIGLLSLVWGVFNTWELIFRVQRIDEP